MQVSIKVTHEPNKQPNTFSERVEKFNTRKFINLPAALNLNRRIAEQRRRDGRSESVCEFLV